MISLNQYHIPKDRMDRLAKAISWIFHPFTHHRHSNHTDPDEAARDLLLAVSVLDPFINLRRELTNGRPAHLRNSFWSLQRHLRIDQRATQEYLHCL